MNDKPSITPSDYIETLRRSSLPTVITEGTDDYFVFRRIEERFSRIGVSLMPVGGKTAVLELFKNRSKFTHIRTAFIVDRDTWIFSGVPSEYIDPDLIITDGFSIENDLYRDGSMESLLLSSERTRFHKDLEILVGWFSYAVNCFLNDHGAELDCHPNEVIDKSGGIRTSFAHRVGYTQPCQPLFQEILDDYAKQLRGKTLLQLLLVFLSDSKRAVKHSRKGLMEAAAVRNEALMKRIHDQLESIFGQHAPGSA